MNTYVKTKTSSGADNIEIHTCVLLDTCKCAHAYSYEQICEEKDFQSYQQQGGAHMYFAGYMYMYTFIFE